MFKILAVSTLILILIFPVIETAIITTSSLAYNQKFQENSMDDSIQLCNSKSNKKRDECLYYLAIFWEENSIIANNICGMIRNNLNKDTCHAVLNRCDKIIDEDIKEFCELNQNV